jgi:hypothetical protein
MNRARLLFYPIVVLLAAGGLYGWHWFVRRNTGDDLETWLKRADSSDAGERLRAADAVGKMGRDSDKAWATLARMTVQDTDIDVQNMALDHLQRLCQPNPAITDANQLQRKRETIQFLLDALKKGEPQTRYLAPRVLYKVAGLEFHERTLKRVNDDEVDREMRPLVVNALVAALNDNVSVRAMALSYLARLDRIPAAAEPALLAALDDEDLQVNLDALDSLSVLDQLSENAIPALVEEAQDESEEVREVARTCLKRLGAKSSLALRAALEKSSARKRDWLQAALDAIKEDPEK